MVREQIKKTASLLRCRDIRLQPPYLSTAMATRVKTDADTEIPCTMPLILQTRLPKGHPDDRRDAVSGLKQQQELISKVGVALKGIHKPTKRPGAPERPEGFVASVLLSAT